LNNFNTTIAGQVGGLTSVIGNLSSNVNSLSGNLLGVGAAAGANAGLAGNGALADAVASANGAGGGGGNGAGVVANNVNVAGNGALADAVGSANGAGGGSTGSDMVMQDSTSGSQDGAALRGQLDAADKVVKEIGDFSATQNGTTFTTKPKKDPPAIEIKNSSKTVVVDRTGSERYITAVQQVGQLHKESRNSGGKTSTQVVSADPRAGRIATANAALRVVGDWSDDD
jgi:hypothetical protein